VIRIKAMFRLLAVCIGCCPYTIPIKRPSSLDMRLMFSPLYFRVLDFTNSGSPSTGMGLSSTHSHATTIKDGVRIAIVFASAVACAEEDDAAAFTISAIVIMNGFGLVFLPTITSLALAWVMSGSPSSSLWVSVAVSCLQLHLFDESVTPNMLHKHQ
jgi:hypothetical protein